MKHPFLKLGAFTLATATTAVGSLILADKSMKKLVEGKLADGESKVRKPVDEIVTANNPDRIVKEKPQEPKEEILPNLSMDEVASIINAASSQNAPTPTINDVEDTQFDAQPIPQDPAVVQNDYFEEQPVETDFNNMPFAPAGAQDNFEPQIEMPFAAAGAIDPVPPISPEPQFELSPTIDPVPVVDPATAIEPEVNFDSEISMEPMDSFNQFETGIDNDPVQVNPEAFNNFATEMPFAPASQPEIEMSAQPVFDTASEITMEMPQQPEMPVAPQLPDQPDIQVAPQMPVQPEFIPNEIPVVPDTQVQPPIPQEQSIYNDYNNAMQQPVEEDVMVTRPISDEPTVFIPEEVQEAYQEQPQEFQQEEEIEIVTHPSYIQEPKDDSGIELTAGPSFAQYQQQAQPEPVVQAPYEPAPQVEIPMYQPAQPAPVIQTEYQPEPQVEMPMYQPAQPIVQQQPVENVEPKVDTKPTYGQPVLDTPFKVGKTRVIGTSIVSDEPENKAIEMVTAKYPNLEKNRLVSIMAQDGSGIVFEFSTAFKRNENTLVNVYSTTSDGNVILPTDEERIGALNFGQSFITDKAELSEFFDR